MNYLNNIDEVAELNRKHGGHWFDPGAKRFFGSIPRNPVSDRAPFFVSSEKRDGTLRAYTVRRYNVHSGQIDSVGRWMPDGTLQSYQAFSTLKAANNYARMCAEIWEEKALYEFEAREAANYFARKARAAIEDSIKADPSVLGEAEPLFPELRDPEFAQALAHLVYARKERLGGSVEKAMVSERNADRKLRGA